MTTAPKCPQCEEAIPADAPDGVCPRCLVGLGFDSVGVTPSGKASHTSAFVPPTADELATHFPQLEILEYVGCGGMGAVYKARQLHLDRVVALKILPSEFATDPTFAERFAREAQAMAKLSHPNIVLVFDFGEANEIPYLIMEFVDGVNLRGAIHSKELGPEQAIAVISQICVALQYAHDVGVVHRDIKPENILLDRTGRVKIADFGLAKLLGSDATNFTLTGSRQTMGTPHYMAPEQMDNSQQVDHRADIYALGVVFYELLTGELPIGRFSPPSQKATVDARLDDVVHKILENEPDRRYQQASEVKTDIDAITNALQPARSKVTVNQVLRDWRRDLQTGREGISEFGFQHLLADLLKWAAFAFHVFFFYQLVRVIGIGPETKQIGGWMTKSHARGSSAEFLNAPGPVLAWFVAGLVSYYVYWRSREVSSADQTRASSQELSRAKSDFATWQVDARERCMQIAATNPDKQAGATALLMVARWWPDSAEAKRAHERLLAVTETLPMDSLGNALNDGKVGKDGELDSWRPFVARIVERVKREPDDEDSAWVLSRASCLVAPDRYSSTICEEFVAIGDLIRNRFAARKGIQNFCEMVGGMGYASE